MNYTTTLALTACTLLIGCGDSKSEAPFTPDEAGASPSTDVAVVVSHPLPGDPEAGKAVYMRICVACHQPDGSGMNGMLAANFVTDKTRLAKSNELLLTSIREGVTKDNKVMPPQKGILSDQEMKDALSYIRKTFGD